MEKNKDLLELAKEHCDMVLIQHGFTPIKGITDSYIHTTNGLVHLLWYKYKDNRKFTVHIPQFNINNYITKKHMQEENVKVIVERLCNALLRMV